MKKRSTLVTVLLAVVLSFSIIDPFHLVTGKYDSNPYSDIARELDESPSSSVMAIASYADFFKFPVYKYLRDILGTRLAYHGENSVEYGYRDLIVQASLGEESFLQYMRHRGISYIIVPASTAETGFVFHRWSTHGTVNLDLNSSVFSLAKKSSGDYPLVLYKVNYPIQTRADIIPPSYSLEWSGVRAEFYSLLRIIDERYKVTYLRKYEERIDTAWVFDGEQVEMTLVSKETPDQEFVVEMQFVAAYGENAPTQVLKLSMGEQVKAVTLKAGEVNTVSFTIRNGETIQINSVFACKEGTSFSPLDNDARTFCYGLRNIDLRIAG